MTARRDTGTDLSSVAVGGMLLLVGLGFLGLGGYVTTASRSGNAMMTMIAVLGSLVLGGTGAYIVYGAMSGDEVRR